MAPTLCALLFIVFINSAQSVYEFSFDGGWIRLIIGTPTQGFQAYFRIYTDKILVDDSECGKRASNCPKYCENGSFQSINPKTQDLSADFSLAYCQPLCGYDIGPGTEFLYCPHPGHAIPYPPYNSTASKTFEDTGEDWREWSSAFKPYYGKFARDVVRFPNMRGSDLKLTNVTFGRILIGDSR